ncbi:Six-hairpin glycosidase-like protein [Tuber borchii]|uniref:glucan 1,4-alpha-glucosidase n=1 Tax=Tuber borchii TaxID=42251 RepID=A0A2T6ZQU2_TUBBO|nr:Six-hairpin glycosidase-like protein [Tuber borchii]
MCLLRLWLGERRGAVVIGIAPSLNLSSLGRLLKGVPHRSLPQPSTQLSGQKKYHSINYIRVGIAQAATTAITPGSTTTTAATILIATAASAITATATPATTTTATGIAAAAAKSLVLSGECANSPRITILSATTKSGLQSKAALKPSKTQHCRILVAGASQLLLAPSIRPQRDEPTLRALTLINFIRAVNQTHPELVTLQWIGKLYDPDLAAKSIIKSDLEYVSHHWNAFGFDLWEEIEDLHFFTVLVQHKALVQGRDPALSLGDYRAVSWYDNQQAALNRFIKTEFWDGRNGHLKAYQHTPYRSGLDCSIMLGSIHSD